MATKKQKPKGKDIVLERADHVTNPYGVNQWTPPDPRQDLFWGFYKDPKSPTFSVATKSAIKAGYTEVSALHITKQSWFLEVARRAGLLELAEKALQEAVTVDVNVPIMTMFGPLIDKVTGQEKKKVSFELLRTKLDAGKFIASTQGKHKGYSTKHEVEHTIKPTPILGGATIVDVEVKEEK